MVLPLFETALQGTRIVPILVLDDPSVAVSVAKALVNGGLRHLEVTLRTPAAFACAEAIATEVPEATVGLGTLTRAIQFSMARDVGAEFLVSPGLTPQLAEAALAAGLPYLPGIATVSEAIAAWEYGFREMKFFPAQINGGAPALRSFAPLLRDVRFCPTGGITPETVPDYLTLPNVFALGGTWLTPANLIADKQWSAIERLASAAVSLAREALSSP